MLTFLPAPIVGLISLFLYLINLIINALLIIFSALLSYVIPIKKIEKILIHFSHQTVPHWWIQGNNFIIWLTTKTKWEIQDEEIDSQGWYLLISNHRSWLDIIVLEKIFDEKAPMLKFFMKKELLWTLPVAGIACWAMGFPFMKRYSKSYLKKHPEKAGTDLENTRRACEKFKRTPMTIVNFIEGTRYTPEKASRQSSPYQHLLKPKAGGVAFTLEALKEHLNVIINTTIIYPDPKTDFWQFLCGRTKKIIVRYEIIHMHKVELGNYFEDQKYRVQFQRWLNRLWEEKDQLISETIKSNNEE